MRNRLTLLLCLLTALTLTVDSRAKTYTAGDARTQDGVGDTPAALNLKDFGATGDGVSDDGPALQAALDALAAAGGGTLFVPEGRYAVLTPVEKSFAGTNASITIYGVPSNTPVAPPNASPTELATGLNLKSEFLPRTGKDAMLILVGLRSATVKDLAFVGTPGVVTDAAITLAFVDIDDALLEHSEFYGVSSSGSGSVVVSLRSDFKIKRTVFLGCTANSGVYTSVVQNVEWKGFTMEEAIFIDYGLRPELFSKTVLAAPFAWVDMGNAAALTNDSPRREAVFRSVFMDEGGMNGIASLPERYSSNSPPADLIYVTGLKMNVSNLGSSGHYFSGARAALVEDSLYGWSHNADSAIRLQGVGHAILDRVKTEASATRLRADAATARLTVIDSEYTELASLAQQTVVIETAQPDEDPVQYVRARFQSALGRAPDPAAHFYWSDKILRCGTDAACVATWRAALDAYLASSPPANFSITGKLVDDSNAPVAGASVALTGSQTAATTTDAGGNYHFSNLPTSGVYTVTVSAVHHTFAPPSRTFTTPAGDVSADFDATLKRYAISGRITDDTGAALAGATLKLTGSHTASATTGGDGAYSFEVTSGGTYTVTPSKKDYTFSPTSRSFNAVDGDRAADFDAQRDNVVEFGSASLVVGEGSGSLQVTVTREGGDASEEVSAVYEVSSGTALRGSDVIGGAGRVTFAPGEKTKTFTLFITDDSLVEGSENFTVSLTPEGDAVAGERDTVAVTISDNDTDPSAQNAINGDEFFVRQQYRDFLGRDPDAPGLKFWTDLIKKCGTDAACREAARINVSAAFFLAIEFQQSGFFVHKAYMAAYGRAPERLKEFTLDSREISAGIIVGELGWEQKLETHKATFVSDFVARPEFEQQFPLAMTPAQFVAALDENTGDSLTGAEESAAAQEFAGAGDTEDLAARARALRAVLENGAFHKRETNPAFVLMEYYGYLRRAPDDPPNTNLDGYNFWLKKLNDNGGDFKRAEMVKAFLSSEEYRDRFGQ